jgi:cellulose synthase/poly-beta-1,6-N-acetylglucosamine synthase-like glycosyltransferase
MTATPVVSVVLPIFNGAPYLPQAIESILTQSYTDFELIAIDDGSVDDSLRIVRQYGDERIRVISQANKGLPATLNRGIGLARGHYIGRQDQDDVAFPERLGRQVAFLDEHPACGLVGTWAEIWRGDARTDRAHTHPIDDADLRIGLLFNNPFVHSSVMIRKTALDKVGPYTVDPGRQPPEDYELWSRISREFEIANIPKVLHAYREVDGSMSRVGQSPFLEHLVTISAENIAWAADLEPTDAQVTNIAALVHAANRRIQGQPDFVAMRDILGKALTRVSGNGEQATHDAAAVVEGLRDQWLGRRPRRLRRILRRARGFLAHVAGAAPVGNPSAPRR